DDLKDALKTFTNLGLPFESALVRTDLATAYRADGAASLADMELRTALAEFERLGAVVQADTIAATSD
ncbi:MAG TPA: LuxR family transcriptional regulator, partial [Acidimicrobiia bacterium]